MDLHPAGLTVVIFPSADDFLEQLFHPPTTSDSPRKPLTETQSVAQSVLRAPPLISSERGLGAFKRPQCPSNGTRTTSVAMEVASSPFKRGTTTATASKDTFSNLLEEGELAKATSLIQRNYHANVTREDRETLFDSNSAPVKEEKSNYRMNVLKLVEKHMDKAQEALINNVKKAAEFHGNSAFTLATSVLNNKFSDPSDETDCLERLITLILNTDNIEGALAAYETLSIFNEDFNSQNIALESFTTYHARRGEIKETLSWISKIVEMVADEEDDETQKTAIAMISRSLYVLFQKLVPRKRHSIINMKVLSDVIAASNNKDWIPYLCMSFGHAVQLARLPLQIDSFKIHDATGSELELIEWIRLGHEFIVEEQYEAIPFDGFNAQCYSLDDQEQALACMSQGQFKNARAIANRNLAVAEIDAAQNEFYTGLIAEIDSENPRDDGRAQSDDLVTDLQFMVVDGGMAADGE